MAMASSGASDIAAVAARIQERALQLQTEQASLHHTLAQLEGAKETLHEEERRKNAIRQSLLQASQTRNTVELEFLKLRRDVEDAHSKIKCDEKETLAMHEQFDKIREKSGEANHVYASHIVEMDIYKSGLEGRYRAHDERCKKRQGELNDLVTKIKEATREANEMEQEWKRVRRDVQELSDREIDEDEESAAIALQIKAALAKKHSLREALRDAKSLYEEANDDMVRWEKERLQLSRA